MSPPTETLQRIASLTPLAGILARLDASVSPVAARNSGVEAAIGAVLAAEVAAPTDFPRAACALRDGWAVSSEQVADASSYAPAILASPPLWVDAGQPLPAGTDAVLPVDALSVSNGGAEVHVPSVSGEGVLPARADAAKGTVLRKAGERLRAMDAAVLRTLAVETVSIRASRVKILPVSVSAAEADATAPLIARAVQAAGGMAEIVRGTSLEAVLSRPECDAIVTIGGTGTGKHDAAVKTLARVGNVGFHGFGIAPGETAAFGHANDCPVLMLPGRLDAALAAFLLVGNKLLSRLSGASETATGVTLSLTRKIASTIGLGEVVFVRRVAGGIEPLGTGIFTAQVLLQADGWVFVPAGSEGLPAGAAVEMRNLP